MCHYKSDLRDNNLHSLSLAAWYRAGTRVRYVFVSYTLLWRPRRNHPHPPTVMSGLWGGTNNMSSCSTRLYSLSWAKLYIVTVKIYVLIAIVFVSPYHMCLHFVYTCISWCYDHLGAAQQALNTALSYTYFVKLTMQNCFLFTHPATLSFICSCVSGQLINVGVIFRLSLVFIYDGVLSICGTLL